MTRTAERAGREATIGSLIDREADFGEISAQLDALTPEARIGEVRAIGASGQRKLWRLAEGKGALDVQSFIASAERTVIYEGKNSLLAFTRFQKRFWRPSSGDVFGFNMNAAFLTLVTGPGYFVVENAKNGEILFDYTRLPARAPDGWPDVRPNSGLVPGIVFGGMLDYVRFVSKTTVIGAAFKGGKPRNQYFLLTLAA